MREGKRHRWINFVYHTQVSVMLGTAKAQKVKMGELVKKTKTNTDHAVVFLVPSSNTKARAAEVNYQILSRLDQSSLLPTRGRCHTGDIGITTHSTTLSFFNINSN